MLTSIAMMMLARDSPDEQYCILVVDDEPDIRDAVSELLQDGLQNVRVLTASSGAQGLDILRKESIDLIITDYKMPEMNGVQFLQQARTLAPKVPRILITAFEQELARELTSQTPVNGVFHKPLQPRPMVLACQKLLSQSHA